jgi:hypothetical protein
MNSRVSSCLYAHHRNEKIEQDRDDDAHLCMVGVAGSNRGPERTSQRQSWRLLLLLWLRGVSFRPGQVSKRVKLWWSKPPTVVSDRPGPHIAAVTIRAIVVPNQLKGRKLQCLERENVGSMGTVRHTIKKEDREIKMLRIRKVVHLARLLGEASTSETEWESLAVTKRTTFKQLIVYMADPNLSTISYKDSTIP